MDQKTNLLNKTSTFDHRNLQQLTDDYKDKKQWKQGTEIDLTNGSCSNCLNHEYLKRKVNETKEKQEMQDFTEIDIKDEIE